MKRTISIFLFYVTCFIVQAQTNIDSLIHVLDNHRLSNDEKILTYKSLVQFYLDNEMDKTFEYSEKGLALAQKENNKAMESWFVTHIACCYDTWGRSDSSLILHQEAITLALESGNESVVAISYGNAGNFYFFRERYILAMDYYMKALSFNERVGNKRQTVVILSQIGALYRSLLNNERAVYYLERANEMAEEIGFDYGIMCACYDLGLIYLESKEINKALEYISDVIKFSHLLSDKQFEILGLQALAYIYCDGYKDYDKAELYAMNSLHIAEEFGDQRLIRCTWIALSDIYLEQRNYSKCKYYAMKVWTDSTDLSEGNVSLNLTIANAFLENEDEASFFFWKTRDLYQDYVSKGFRETIADLEVKYETEKKEMRIAVLEEKQKLYIGMGITIGLTLVLIIILLLVHRRLILQKRKVAEQQHELSEQKVKQLEHEKLLIATQSLLEGETAERSRLARDLHDGLGGMLSVVKLNLNGIRNYTVLEVSDVKRFNRALDMLDQSIGELRHIAHHMMPESLMRYGLKTSVEDFCRSIPIARFQSYGNEERLDDRLEVVLYRCAYELINNAVKYAEATAINVQLIIDNGLVSLTVQDNGLGFDPEQVISGSGIDNIRTRVSAYNGKMTIHSAPGKGTEISIEIENSSN